MHDTAFTQIVISVASTLTAAALLWLASSVRRVGRTLRRQHTWLMETTALHSKQIEANTNEILRIVNLMDRRARR